MGIAKPILFIDFYKTLNHDVYWRSLSLEIRVKIQEFLFKNRQTLVEIGLGANILRSK